jgi:hypothetical protein
MVDVSRLSGWNYEAGDSQITMIAPDMDSAEDYLYNLRRNPQNFIKWDTPVELFVKIAKGTYRYRVPLTDSVGSPQTEPENLPMNIETQINPITLLHDSDYQRMTSLR